LVTLRLLLALCALLLALLAAPSAQAYDSYYYCELKPSGSWCDGQANGTYDGINSWDWQEAWYPGEWNNTVTACQRLYRPSDGYVATGASCSLNRTYNAYGTVTCYCYEAEARQYSGGPHTIWGHAIAN
jgi:hypothetical protein